MHSSRSIKLVAASLVALSACGNIDPSDGGGGGDVATAIVALTQVPSGVRCLRITATGSRTVTRTFNVTPGMSSVFEMSGLPTGTVSFLGEAFAERCRDVVATSVATWLSDPLSVTLTPGMVAHVTLIMRINGR